MCARACTRCVFAACWRSDYVSTLGPRAYLAVEGSKHALGSLLAERLIHAREEALVLARSPRRRPRLRACAHVCAWSACARSRRGPTPAHGAHAGHTARGRRFGVRTRARSSRSRHLHLLEVLLPVGLRGGRVALRPLPNRPLAFIRGKGGKKTYRFFSREKPATARSRAATADLLQWWSRVRTRR